MASWEGRYNGFCFESINLSVTKIMNAKCYGNFGIHVNKILEHGRPDTVPLDKKNERKVINFGFLGDQKVKSKE